jgi:hypothetical protein
VNDRRVDAVALGEGDRIRLGATILVVEAIDDGATEDLAAADPAAPPRRAASGG